MLSRRAVGPKLHKMPSAKVVPMKCGPECTGLQCHPTTAAPSSLRKQSNSSCSSSSVATPSIHSNSSLCNNLNSLNTQSSLIASSLVYDPAQCTGGNCTSNCTSNCSNCLSKPNLPVCTKACCSRNTHLVTLQTQKQPTTRHSAGATSNAFQTNGGTACACCSPANQPANSTAIKSGMRLQTNKCTDQCYLASGKPSSAGGQCCSVNGKPNGQTAIGSSLHPANGSQAKSNALSGSISSNAIVGQTHYDHRLNQSTQACQMLDNDRVYGANARAGCSVKYSTMAPDLNYNPNQRCSLAHVPSSSSSSSNCKQSTVKCTPASLTAYPGDLGYSGHPSATNGNLSKGNHSKCLDCCSAQHERAGRGQSKAGNAKHFKSSINEFGQSNGGQSYYGGAYRNERCPGKGPENRCTADKCNEKYPACSYNEKYNNDRCNNKYAADRYDKHPDKHGDKYADRCGGDKFAADKCPERYPNNCYPDKCCDASRSDKQFDKCSGRCGEKANCWENGVAHDKQPGQALAGQQANDRQSTDNKQPNDDQLTPYEKVLRGLKKRARHRIERKEEDSSPYVGMYRLRKEIGNGNFSQVFTGAHCLTKDKVAIKVLKRDKLDDKTRNMLEREIRLMDQLHHPHVVRLFEVIETLSRYYLVMEYAGGGELYQKVHQEGRLNERLASHYFAQIVSAIDHLHSHNIIHRDIKSENIFFADKSCMNILVGDFGFANEVTASNQFLKTYCGSPPFASPELFASPEATGYHGPSVDIWALGVLLYFCVTGTMPFNADSVPKLKKIILEGEYHMPRYVSEECQFVIKGLLKHLPQNRLSIEQIKQTKFLSERRFSEPLPSYKLRKQKINSDQLLNSSHLRASSTLQLVSTNDCCKYAKRPVSDGESYAQLKKPDDNYNYKLASLLTQSKQLQPPTSALMNDYRHQEAHPELTAQQQPISKGNLSPQSDSGHCGNCDEDSCKSVDNQPPLDQLPQPIDSTTKLNLYYNNDPQHYASQAPASSGYQSSYRPEEDSGVFKSEHSPKISFKSIENLSPISNDHESSLNQAATNLTSSANPPCKAAMEEAKNDSALCPAAPIITRRLSDNKLSADEQETLKRLKQLGISEQMLEENVDRGVRNSLIGIYRLVLHGVIASRLPTEKEAYREAKRKQRFEPAQSGQTHSEENRLRKSESVSNGQFYEESDRTDRQSQLISNRSKSNRMHYSMDDGLDGYCTAARLDGQPPVDKNDEEEFTLKGNKLTEANQTANEPANFKDSKYSFSDEDAECSILFSYDEETDAHADELSTDWPARKQQRPPSNDESAVDQARLSNEENIYNQQFLTSSKKRTSVGLGKRKEPNEPTNKPNMINDHRKANGNYHRGAEPESDDYHAMQCDLIESYYVHHTKAGHDDAMIMNTNNLESNLCKMTANGLMSELPAKPDHHQPFKPYLNNYLEEEKRWKKHQKKKKKLKKRSVISCCIF